MLFSATKERLVIVQSLGAPGTHTPCMLLDILPRTLVLKPFPQSSLLPPPYPLTSFKILPSDQKNKQTKKYKVKWSPTGSGDSKRWFSGSQTRSREDNTEDQCGAE